MPYTACTIFVVKPLPLLSLLLSVSALSARARNDGFHAANVELQSKSDEFYTENE